MFVGFSLFHLSNHLGNMLLLLTNEGFVGSVVFVSVRAVVHWGEIMFLCPDEPIVHHSSSQQNANSASDRTEDCEPPRPAVNALHRCIETHGPAPEQGRAFRGCPAIIDLFQFTVASIACYRQNGCTMHREQ